MKMNQIVFPLVLALVATMAATGCKKGPTKVTPLHGNQAVVGDPSGEKTLPPGPTINPEIDPNKINSRETTSLSEFEGMIKDSAALAAYTIHFAFDSAAIMKSDKSNLAAVASALKGSATDKLLIEGNCDERGTDEYNRALGERRALAAREALAKLGVSPDRIRTLSNGKDKPTDPGHDKAAWDKNRNDTFILLHPKAGM